MSKKTQLINLFMEYKSKYEAAQAHVIEINKNPEYTEVGRQQAISMVLDDFTNTALLYHDKAINIINEGLESLIEKWKKNSTGKLQDVGYQIGLSNAIKMLEMGAVTEESDIQNIIDTYEGDFNALAVIKKTLSNSGNKEQQKCTILIPADNREQNKRLLEQLKGNVDKYINIHTVGIVSKSWNCFNHGLSGVSASLDSMGKFVNDRLGNDLELLD